MLLTAQFSSRKVLPPTFGCNLRRGTCQHSVRSDDDDYSTYFRRCLVLVVRRFLAQDGLQAHVEEMRLALADKDERVKALTAEVAALRREEDRAKKNAKFDQVARDGQTKKLGILEHSLRTVRHDLQTNLERRLDD